MHWKSLEKNDPILKKLVSKEIKKYIQKARWYGGKANQDKSLLIDHLLPLDYQGERFYFLLIEILYDRGFVHNYMLPLAKCNQAKLAADIPVICNYPGTDHVLIDAVYSDKFRKALFSAMENGKTIDLSEGKLMFERGKSLKTYKRGRTFKTSLLNAEQSNTTIVYNDTFYLKLYRRLFRDANPDIEMAQFLSEATSFKNIPAFASSMTWARDGIYDVSFGMMQEKVINKGDAWSWALGFLENTFEFLKTEKIKSDDIPATSLFEAISIEQIPDKVKEILSEEFLQGIKKLGQRTADMHIHVSSNPINRLFSKQTYNGDYSVWLKNRLKYIFEARYSLLDQNIGKLSRLAKEYANYFLDNKTEIKMQIYAFDYTLLTSQRIRIHGDYHLGQVLVQDDDFCILDFEGEPESTIHDRKVKQSALKDVSGMFRSFHYAIYSTIFSMDLPAAQRKKQFEIGEKLYRWLVNLFLFYYLQNIYSSHLNIGYRPEINYLLKYHLLEKAIYELGYELNARPAWAIIPLRGIYTILNEK